MLKCETMLWCIDRSPQAELWLFFYGIVKPWQGIVKAWKCIVKAKNNIMMHWPELSNWALIVVLPCQETAKQNYEAVVWNNIVLHQPEPSSWALIVFLQYCENMKRYCESVEQFCLSVKQNCDASTGALKLSFDCCPTVFATVLWCIDQCPQVEPLSLSYSFVKEWNNIVMHWPVPSSWALIVALR